MLDRRQNAGPGSVRAGWRNPALLLAWVVAVAGVAVAWTTTWSSFSEYLRAVDDGRGLFSDFVLRFYPVARDYLELRRPYPGYYYSPTFAVLLTPLGFLDQSGAVRAWGAVQVLTGLVLLVAPTVWLARRRAWAGPLYVLVVLTSMPMLHNFKWGQVSAPLVLATLGALLLYRRGHVVASAALLALAVTIKFYPGVYALYFLFRRDFRYLGWLAGFGIAFGLFVPFLALGPADTFGFYATVVENLRFDQGKMSLGINSQYLPHVVERWGQLAGSGMAAPIPPEAGTLRITLRWLCRALFVGLGIRLWLSVPRNPDPVPAFALLSASLPLLIPSSWPHYFLFLPFFQVWALARLASGGLRADAVVWLARSWILATLVAGSVIGYRMAGDWRTYAYVGIPLLTALPFLVLPQGRRLSAPAADPFTPLR